MEAIKELKKLYLKEHYNNGLSCIPESARFAPAYNDKTANELTKSIIDWLRLNGHQAERISVTGRYINNSRIVYDCLGRSKRIGQGKYIPASMQKGTADISSTIKNKNGIGLSVKIEVKIGNDRQSEAQKQYQKQIEQSGGFYFIAKNFESFFNWYKSIIE
jgi:hypothetical protein